MHVRPQCPPSYSAKEAVFSAVRAALTRQVVLEMEYEGLNGDVTRRRVHPQAMVFGPRGLYLFAFDETREGDLRTFRLERIGAARASGEEARRDASFDVRDFLAGSPGIHSPEHEVRRFELRVHSAAAERLLRENPLHPSQVILSEPSGACHVRLELTSSRELVAQVLALGEDAEVLYPATLRRETEGRLRRALARYRPRSSREEDRRQRPAERARVSR